jgi:hypothetical protein
MTEVHPVIAEIANALHGMAEKPDPGIEAPRIAALLREKFVIVPWEQVVCATHGQLPATAEEMEELDQGLDPCIFSARVFEHDIPQGRVIE